MNTELEIKNRFKLQKEFLGEQKQVNQIQPLVSVTTTTYQHVNYIEDCIKGVLIQKTTFPFEFIIGEDGSTDGTSEICKRYAKEYPDKIRLFIRDRTVSHLFDDNGNFVKRLNSIFNKMSAKGKYIALCEGDDYWTDPLKLQKQVDFLELNPNVSVVTHGTKVYNVSRNLFSKPIAPYSDDCYVEFSDVILRGGGLFSTNSMVFRRDYILNLPSFFNSLSFGDYPLIIWLRMKGEVYYITKFMSVYRQAVPGSWTAKNRSREELIRHQQDLMFMLENFKFMKNKIANEFIDKRVNRVKFNLLLLQLKFPEIENGDFKYEYSEYKSELNFFGLMKHYFERFLISRLVR